ncbi:MAG: metalloregulator ArsR/SmtB family transcription factor [Pseudomonadota bacterium]|nr:metalloregulator ArsR/SmtB family transcription factor [Pseudomonadota bacterium]
MKIKTNLDIEQAAQGFAAIGSEARLQVLLILVRAGDSGLTVGEIQERSGMAASTLAHHLRFLASAGLIDQSKQGRSVVNHAVYHHLEALAGYILKECCADETPSRSQT